MILYTHYRSKKTAWMVGENFTLSLEIIWFPEVRKRTSADVCVILDNCATYGDAPRTKRSRKYFLPLNVTSIYQPLDMGILIIVTQQRASVEGERSSDRKASSKAARD